MTVLVVDDESDVVEATRSALEAAGFQVLDADSYSSALPIFETHRDEIAIALLDISLPGRNGVELARDLLKRNPTLKILFVSGHVGAEVIRFYGMPANDRHFLKKPFHAGQLISRVQELLRSPEPLRLGDSGADSHGAETANGL